MSIEADTPKPAAAPLLSQSDVPRDVIARGLTMAAIAMLLYAVSDAVAKLVMARIDPAQILVARSILALALGFGVALGREGIRAVFVTRQPWVQAARGYAGVISMLCYMTAIMTLPLADAVAITYSAPVVATLLAIPILGDRVGPRRLTAVAIGFVGVVLVAKPSGVADPGVLYALAGMLLYALLVVLTRRLGRTDSGLTTHIYTQFCFLTVCGPMLLFVWVTPTPMEAIMILGVAVASAVAVYLITQAQQSTPPAIVAPMDYTVMVWSAMLAYAIWGDLPDAVSVVGIVLITATGLYIAQRELKQPLNRTGPFYLWARRHRP